MSGQTPYEFYGFPVPEGGNRIQSKAGPRGRIDRYYPEPGSGRYRELRRGFDEYLAHDHPLRDFPDYFAARVPPEQRPVSWFEEQGRQRFLNETIHLYPGKLPRSRCRRCRREEAGHIFAMLYSDFDIVLGFERRINGSRIDVVVETVGQIHPGFQGSRVRGLPGRPAMSQVELDFEVSRALADEADSHFLALRALDNRFELVPLELLPHGRHPEFQAFNFPGTHFLAGRFRRPDLHISIVGGYVGIRGKKMIGKISLWFSIRPGASDFVEHGFLVQSSLLRSRGGGR